MSEKYTPEKLKNKMKEIKENGGTVYSISRLNSFNNCNYEYFLTYIERSKSEDNIYTYLGSAVHDSFEDIYKNNKDKGIMSDAIDEAINDCDMIGVTFPKESIGNSWKRDMSHFAKNFKKMDNKFSTERFFLMEVLPNIWLQGYIDAVDDTDKDNVIIIDWKTSSKFTNKDLQKHGRQLITYLLSEEKKGNKVSKVGWYMTKYMLVKWNQPTKTKDINPKQRICQRGKWVMEIEKNIAKDLIALDYDPIELELELRVAVDNNNLDNLPKEIQQKYLTEDYVREYNIGEAVIEETKNYIKNTVNEIESKSKIEEDWNPVEISAKNEFYCNVLCNHRKTCKYLQQYKLDKEVNRDVIDDLDDIL